jgi:hypothetical protein
MRHRIYWLLPDVPSARRVMNELLLARVEHRHMHFMAREGTDLSGLREASALQSSDVVHAARRGLLVGAALGAVMGAVLAMSGDMGDSAKPLLVGTLAAMGALFGAWASSLIGASIPNRRLKRFEAALQRGGLLLMADVPHRRMREITALLQAAHPDAHFEGEDSHIPVFP